MKNLGLKGLSLLIATLLCIFVNSENNISSARIFVAVEVRDLPTDKVIVWQLKKQVEVEVRGPSFLVSRISATPPTLRLKLPQEVGARYSAQINKNDLDIQPPLQVLSIEPSSIAFTIENKVTRELPIKVPQIGIIDENLKIDSVKVSPEKVTIIGPESEVRDLQYITSAPLDLKEIKQTNDDELILRVPGKQSELSRGTVRVQIDVTPINVKHTFEALPVEIRTGSGEAVRVEPASVAVTVVGTKVHVEAIAPDTVIPFVRVPIGSTGDDMVGVQVDLPDNISLSSVEPLSVKVIRTKVVKKEKKK